MKLGPWEIGLILVIVLIIFGAGRLANLGKDMGRAIRGFREASKTDEDKAAAELEPEEKPSVKKASGKTTKSA